MDNLIRQKNKVVHNIKKYFKHNGFTNAIIGISGGIDSAVSLCILNEALKTKNIYAYFINIESDLNDYQDAYNLCKQLNIDLNYIDLTPIYNNFINITCDNNQISRGNIKSRLRMTFLYQQAYNHHGLVCGNANLDELYLGYFTKYGDNACDFFVLNNFIKSDIYALAKYYNVPTEIIQKIPSANLYPEQTDEKDLGLSYTEIDKFFKNDDVSKNTINKIELLHNQNRHKLFYNYDINIWNKYKKWWKRIK